ncbi:ORF111 [Saltwater crocodilepox virus]|nr:ORF111 [Saltwater crocodilepox virus]QGT47840.1 ORF111 [Saltwater crocodilepox virus]QGT48050.1 ORF111 [Saltwater crocodilepox virus]QGT48264.1 ORF111 [Saltwater crocodilepox virus]QGT48480.1 ORF111 [Saltwater crocodilepox virus]
MPGQGRCEHEDAPRLRAHVHGRVLPRDRRRPHDSVRNVCGDDPVRPDPLLRGRCSHPQRAHRERGRPLSDDRRRSRLRRHGRVRVYGEQHVARPGAGPGQRPANADPARLDDAERHVFAGRLRGGRRRALRHGHQDREILRRQGVDGGVRRQEDVRVRHRAERRGTALSRLRAGPASRSAILPHVRDALLRGVLYRQQNAKARSQGVPGRPLARVRVLPRRRRPRRLDLLLRAAAVVRRSGLPGRRERDSRPARRPRQLARPPARRTVLRVLRAGTGPGGLRSAGERRQVGAHRARAQTVARARGDLRRLPRVRRHGMSGYRVFGPRQDGGHGALRAVPRPTRRSGRPATSAARADRRNRARRRRGSRGHRQRQRFVDPLRPSRSGAARCRLLLRTDFSRSLVHDAVRRLLVDRKKLKNELD